MSTWTFEWLKRPIIKKLWQAAGCYPQCIPRQYFENWLERRKLSLQWILNNDVAFLSGQKHESFSLEETIMEMHKTFVQWCMSIQVVKYQKLSPPINKSLNFNLNCKLRLQQADGKIKLNKLVSCLPVTINSNNADAPSSYWDENYAQPYFDNTTRRDITVTIGQTSILHCRVRNLGDRAVSIFYHKFKDRGKQLIRSI